MYILIFHMHIHKGNSMILYILSISCSTPKGTCQTQVKSNCEKINPKHVLLNIVLQKHTVCSTKIVRSVTWCNFLCNYNYNFGTTTVVRQATNVACCTKCRRRSVLQLYRNYVLHYINFILMATVCM